MLLIDGFTAAANFQFICIVHPMAIFNSWICPLLAFFTYLGFVWTSSPPMYFLFGMTLFVYFTRVLLIGLKYALLSDVRPLPPSSCCTYHSSCRPTSPSTACLTTCCLAGPVALVPDTTPAEHRGS